MAHLKNQLNGYALELGDLFDTIPKSVFAAIAVSALTSGGDQLESAKRRIALEWEMLHAAGIVPQKPNACATNLARKAREFGEGL